MAKTYRPYLSDQDFLLPPRLNDWLPEDHLAYFVSDVVDQLDLSGIESVYEKEERGQPPYHPRMMTKILIYAYCVGVFSSRRMEKRLGEDVGFRVLAAGNQPDFRTLSDFRKLHLKVLQELFDQVLQISFEAGKMKLGRVALDGSKVKANASKHKAMSYGRMEEEQKRLRAEVKRLLEQAEAADAEEDAGYGRDRRGRMCRRSWPGARVGCTASEKRKKPWKSGRGRRQKRRANRRKRPSRRKRINITSPIPSRGS